MWSKLLKKKCLLGFFPIIVFHWFYHVLPHFKIKRHHLDFHYFHTWFMSLRDFPKIMLPVVNFLTLPNLYLCPIHVHKYFKILYFKDHCVTMKFLQPRINCSNILYLNVDPFEYILSRIFIKLTIFIRSLLFVKNGQRQL